MNIHKSNYNYEFLETTKIHKGQDFQTFHFSAYAYKSASVCEITVKLVEMKNMYSKAIIKFRIV